MFKLSSSARSGEWVLLFRINTLKEQITFFCRNFSERYRYILVQGVVKKMPVKHDSQETWLPTVEVLIGQKAALDFF